jgi:hypothetical protein
MPTTALQLQREQERANTINAVQQSLSDSTKSLTTDVLTSLVTLATGRNIDGGLIHDVNDRDLRAIAQREVTHMVNVQQLTAQLADHAHTVEVLNNRLNDIRTYLRLGTDEQLSAAVNAGQTKSLPDAELEALKAAAIERAKAHQTSTTKP